MTDPTSDPAVTYRSYLKLDELLSLQQPRSEGPEHDEMLFIIIHQVRALVQGTAPRVRPRRASAHGR